MPSTHNLALRRRYLDVATTSFQILPFDEFRRHREMFNGINLIFIVKFKFIYNKKKCQRLII